MAESYRKAAKDITQWVNRLHELYEKQDTRSFTELESQEIKRDIATGYRHIADNSYDGDFWNWGLESPPLREELADRVRGYAKGSSDGFSEQLYYYLIHKLPILNQGNLVVLDVGCGLGEGTAFIRQILEAENCHGVDISERAIARAKSVHRGTNCQFELGDAEALPFADNMFDVVINVESSHNYPNLDRFLQEVYRVLKPGGYFAWADALTENRQRATSRAFSDASNFNWIIEEDLTPLVKAAISRRLSPDGLLRTRLEERETSFLKKKVMETSAAGALGADLVGYQAGKFSRFLHWLSFPRVPTFEITSYSHAVGQKIPKS